jgi:hypothetical protein
MDKGPWFLNIPDGSAQSWMRRDATNLCVDSDTYTYIAAQDIFIVTQKSMASAHLKLRATGGQFFRMMMQLVLSSSKPCIALIDINGNHQHKIHLPNFDLFVFKCCNIEITEYSELHDTLEIDIYFDFLGEEGQAGVLLARGENGRGSILRSKIHPEYTCSALVFHSAYWTSLLAGCVVWYCYYESTSLLKGAGPAALALATWVFGKFAPTALVKNLIPSPRRVFSTKNRYRRIFITSAAVFLAASIFLLSAQPVKGLFTKLQYQSLTRQALSDGYSDFSSAAELISYLPWRREGFLAVEYQARLLKSSRVDVQVWRSRLLTFLNNSKIEKNYSSPINSKLLPWYLLDTDEAEIVTLDPLIAFAHLLPEAESDSEENQKLRAVYILKEFRAGVPRADLLRLYIEYDLAGIDRQAGNINEDRKKRALVAEKLKLAVESYSKSGSQLRPNEYVSAVDLLGYHALEESALENCSENKLEEAKRYFSQVMEQRRIRSGPDIRFLWRSPGKWRIYHIARYLNVSGDAALDAVYGDDYFPPLAKILKKCPTSEKSIRALFSSWSELAKMDAWEKNSVAGVDLKRFILAEVERGWRF